MQIDTCWVNKIDPRSERKRNMPVYGQKNMERKSDVWDEFQGDEIYFYIFSR